MSKTMKSSTGKKRPRSELSSVSTETDEPVLEMKKQEQPLKAQKNRMQRPRPQKVIVLGAGVSGLACSRELRQRGYEVLVLEARSRVGGRLKGEVLELGAEYPSTLPTSPLLSQKKKRKQQKKNKSLEMNSESNLDAPTTRQHPIDVGGALIHGIENNPIYHITSQMGIPTHAVSSYCLLMDENGWPFDPKVDEKSNNFFNQCLDVTFARAEKDRDSKDSFGVLFERVCREKSGNTNGANSCGTNGRIEDGGKPSKSKKDWETPLLKWHRANLELPTGASFYDLGFTWNEDEPYGFDGPHAAVESSWKLVMERLADGLDILENAPVTEIRVVLPNGTTPLEIPNDASHKGIGEQTSIDDENSINSNHVSEEPTSAENIESKSSESAVKGEMKEELVNVTGKTEPKIPLQSVTPVKKLAKRSRKPKKDFDAGVDRVDRRFSRRTRNLDTDVRRSSRSTKGVIQRLEYDKDWDDNKRRKRKKKSISKVKAEYLDGNGEEAAIGRENKAKENNREEDIDYLPSSVVQITLQDGSVLEADALVSTLPLGVLKLPQKDPNHVRFVPSLNPSKKDAIEKLGCGLLNKCAISFPDAFWQDSDFLGQAESQYSYLVLNAMKYTQKPILIFMYGGDFARDVEDWTDREVISDCLEVLKKICGLRQIPAPIDYCMTRWGKEEYSRMAFTYIPSGVDGGKALSAMSQPVCDPALPEKPLIMFAGEHTTPYHPSTMHGAFLSGIREAYRFDLYMEPFLNNQMAFDENIHVYKHTFPTKRVYKRTRAKKKDSKVAGVSTDMKDDVLPLDSNNIAPSTGKNLSRRRGIGHMSLRKRPETNSIPTSDNDCANSQANTATAVTASNTRSNGIINGETPKAFSRRSKRSVGSARKSILTSATTNRRVEPTCDESLDDKARLEKMKSENKSRADQQEVRTLVRALESYGPGSHSLVRSHILPVYGSTRRRSLKHIHDRWKLFREDNKDNDRKKEGLLTRADLLASWKAKQVVSDNWDTHLARISADASKEASVSVEKDGPSNAPRRTLRGSKLQRRFDS